MIVEGAIPHKAISIVTQGSLVSVGFIYDLSAVEGGMVNLYDIISEMMQFCVQTDVPLHVDVEGCEYEL